MKEKKVAVMTIRMTPGTKAAIEREAERRDWTPSKTAERILSAWAEQQNKRESGQEELNCTPCQGQFESPRGEF